MCIFQILDILINNIFVLNIGRVFQQSVCISMDTYQGRIQDFKLKGVYLKNLRRAEGGEKMSGVFRVKNHDFTPKNNIFFNFRGGGRPLDPLLLIKLIFQSTYSYIHMRRTSCRCSSIGKKQYFSNFSFRVDRYFQIMRCLVIDFLDRIYPNWQKLRISQIL